MTATGTMLLYQLLSARILDHGDAPTLRTTLAGSPVRLFAVSAPDNAPYPHVVMRLQSRRTGDGDDAGLREGAELEVNVFTKPRAQQAIAEGIADRIETALLNFATDTAGAFKIRRKVSRDTMPPFPAPADRELVHVRMVWRYTWWPAHRTDSAVPAGSEPTPQTEV